MVHTNFSLPLPAGSGCFMMSSNGLASGNHLMEATIHAICEVVERDANALWFAGDAAARAASRIDPRTIDDQDCRTVLDLFAAADVAVAIWDTTSDVGLASFRCVVVDRQPNVFRHLYAVDGSGCHPAREIALLRALTEAAQCRLTYISGARDDGDREFFERVRNPDAVARARREVEGSQGGRSFSDAPTRVSADCADDVVLGLRAAVVGRRRRDRRCRSHEGRRRRARWFASSYPGSRACTMRRATSAARGPRLWPPGPPHEHGRVRGPDRAG